MSKRLTKKQFIKKAKLIHGSTYDYSLINYTKDKVKIDIICPIHGQFSQRAGAHTQGQGCPKCATDKSKEDKKYTLEQFIKKSKIIHKGKYCYSKVNYINNQIKVIITCRKHGDFEQKPNNHLRGNNCYKCYVEENKYWSYSDWQEAGKRSKNFDSFKVYIIKCWNEKEEFYKIGKTFLPLKRRFRSKITMPYNYEIVKIIEGEAKEISELEKTLQKENKSNKYLPKINFNSKHECYKILTTF